MPRVDTETLITLKKTGKSYREIAEIVGGNKDVIHRQIRHLLPTETTEEFKKNRADILAQLQCKILSSIDDADIKKAPFGSRILAMAQIYDKERLERGQSTDNVGVLVAGIKDLQSRRWGTQDDQVEGNDAIDAIPDV